MTIKNKDGSTFKLREPNPAMAEQTHWDPKEVVLHNFKWKSVIIPSGHEDVPVRESPKRPPTIADELFEAVVEPEEPEEIPVEEPVEIPQPAEVILPTPGVMLAKPKTGKLQVHCLPASIADFSDDLYGQKYKTIQYGQKFVADASVLSQGDLEATFASADDRITVGTILYPMSMEKRWWKVIGVEERQLGGNTIYCQISETQPRFD